MATPTYVPLATYTSTGGETAVTFSSLSSYAADYQHLQIRAAHRNDANDTAIYLGLRFNSDSASNYNRHFLNGTGSSVTSAALANADYIWLGESVSSQIVANSFAGTVTDILDAFETTKFKTVRSLSGQTGSRNQIFLTSGAWRNTNALSSIELLLPQGGSFITGSRFSLYGIKAA